MRSARPLAADLAPAASGTRAPRHRGSKPRRVVGCAQRGVEPGRDRARPSRSRPAPASRVPDWIHGPPLLDQPAQLWTHSWSPRRSASRIACAIISCHRLAHERDRARGEAAVHVEDLRAADADALHRLQVGGDPLPADVAVDPVPPGVRSGRGAAGSGTPARGRLPLPSPPRSARPASSPGPGIVKNPLAVPIPSRPFVPIPSSPPSCPDFASPPERRRTPSPHLKADGPARPTPELQEAVPFSLATLLRRRKRMPEGNPTLPSG